MQELQRSVQTIDVQEAPLLFSSTVDYLRLRALPASDEVAAFVGKYDRVYVVEQNRDGQVGSLLRSTLTGTLDDRLVSVTHYNGTPIAAENIVRPVLDWERTFLDGLSVIARSLRSR